MAGRHTGWAKKSGDVGTSSDLDTLGRQLLGYLQNQETLSGTSGMTIRRDTPQGTVVASTFGGIPQYSVYGKDEADGAQLEPVVYLYTSSATLGLLEFDLYRKTLVRNLTGLEAFSLCDVAPKGGVAYMGVSTLAVRVDLRAATALGASYTLQVTPLPADDDPEPTVPGTAAEMAAAKLSPDGSLVALRFNAGGLSSGSSVVVRDGYGAFFLVDAETLAPVRPAIRGGMWNASVYTDTVAWSGDSEHFYVPSAFDYDIGDLTSTGQFELFYDSDHHYLAKYTREGVFVSAQQLATWGFERGIRDGFGMLVREVVAANNRLYVAVYAWGQPDPCGVYILDEDLNVLAYETITGFYSWVRQIEIRGSTMILHGREPTGTMFNTYAVYDVSGDAFEHRYSTTDATLVFGEMGFVPNVPTGLPPDPRLFATYNEESEGVWSPTAIRGYTTLQATDDGPPGPVYDFDLTEWSPRFDWRLSVVGARPEPRKAA